MKPMLVLIAAALTVANVSAPVWAEPSRTIRVSYADLDLTSDPGVKVLKRRIDRAAEEVCGGTPSGVEVMVRGIFVKCKQVTLAATEAQVARAIEGRSIILAAK